MFAIADTDRLVADSVITPDQASEIEHRARESMVALAINSVLCLGIIAATAGLIFFLASAVAVAVSGTLALVLGLWILSKRSELYAMFGNAAALIGAGMLIGGATLELLEKFEDGAGWVLMLGGLAVLAVTGWRLRAGALTARFVIGSIGLMGLAMHLGGMGLLLEQTETYGLIKALFFLYAALAIGAAGWAIDVRFVTALAIVPFAQMLDTGTFYFHALYAFYSPESTLSIIQMALLIAVSLWLAGRVGERHARHARVLAVLGFIVANMCALVGSLWGDVVGETVWGPDRRADNLGYEAYQAAREVFVANALVIDDSVYALLWAVALVAMILWAAHRHNRGLLNAGLTFGAIHAYTQFFESFADQPLAYAIGGLAAIPVAWGLWRANRWAVAQRS